MYIELDFNLLYQVERIAKRTGRSVTELVNEAVAQYVENQTTEVELPKPPTDDE